MRVLYLHQYFTTRSGSGGTRSYEMAKHLMSRGHDVTVISGPVSGEDDLRLRGSVDGIQVVQVGHGGNSYFTATSVRYASRIWGFASFAVKSSWAVLRAPKPDVIFATSTPLTIAVPALVGHYLRRVPLVFEVRDLWPEIPIEMGALRNPLLVWLSKRLEHAVYRASKSVIALSPGMRDGVVRAGVDSSKVHVVPNASDLDLFDPSLSGTAIREMLDLDNKFVCVHLGALGEIHDVTDCLEVAKGLSDSGVHDIVFLFVGDGKRRAALESYCGLHHLDNVIFVDPVPRREVPQYLAAADVSLVLVKDIPSLRSASPNKFFDALGAGVPIILNCLGWLKDTVEEADAGEYVPAGEPLKLRRVILGLRGNPSRLATMGVNARRLAEDRFERRVLAGRAARVLEDAV